MIKQLSKSDGKTAIILGINGEIGRLLLDVFINITPKIIGVDKNFTNISKYENIECIEANLAVVNGYNLIFKKVQNADYVVLSLPKDLSIFALHNLYSYIKEGAVIIDTLAVKQNYLEQIINFFEQYPKKVRILSIHPLFKPILGFNNNNIIIIPEGFDDSDKEDCFIKQIRNLGAKITYSTADAHDQMMSIIQALSHILILSFGLTLTKMEYQPEKFKNFTTPLQQNLIALLSRIINGNAHVYWDIQDKNQHNKKIYKQLKQSLDYFIQLISDSNEKEFIKTFTDIKSKLLNVKEEIK